ncbi:MAG: exodeoxyribonuclease VII large subunit [Bacteroidales bacterium]|jgi:exodeoxyribonuclease VII large subunit|nr:exodeoxyribonuclease VII large subunit [Bacteroidales bacterium]
MSEIINNIKVFSLCEVTNSIEKTITERYKSSFWVKAEMLKLNLYTASGHAYPDLVEKKDGKIIAQVRAIMWKNDFERSNKSFQQVTKEPLKDGITIMFQARIKYDSYHGLSLQIIDISPSFSLGELEKERQQTLNRLKTEGIFDLNKALPFPTIPKRLAIISVQTSKGFSDFIQVIEAKQYKVFIHLFPSLLQGDNAIQTMIEALNCIKIVKEYFDAVLIVRGGGGDTGLSCYNNYELCREIACFPLPVLTGIGHSTNETIAEMVAYRNAITPTELADFIIGCFERCDNELNMLKDSLITRVQNKISRERESLAMITKILTLLDLNNLLIRGYSITTLNNKIVKSVNELTKGDLIHTRFADGKIASRVE